MYLREINIKNYGSIENLKYELPFDEKGNPKPVILVGKNGVGKTLLLTNVLNALIEIKRKFYDSIKEVTDNNYYRVGSKNYIKKGYSSSFVDCIFDNEARYTDLMTYFPQDFIENYVSEEFPNVDIKDKRLVSEGFYMKIRKPEENIFEKKYFFTFL